MGVIRDVFNLLRFLGLRQRPSTNESPTPSSSLTSRAGYLLFKIFCFITKFENAEKTEALGGEAEDEDTEGNESDVLQKHQSLLFALPRELRNIIYEFALTEPDGLYCRFKGRKEPFKMYSSLEAADGDDKDDSILESNQLKYVSRQLYDETAGLGIKFNELHFVQTKKMERSSAVQLDAFLAQLTDRQKGWLKVIKLERSKEALDAQLEYVRKIRESGGALGLWTPSEQVEDMCKARAGLTVYYTVPAPYSTRDTPEDYDINLYFGGAVFILALGRGPADRFVRYNRGWQETLESTVMERKESWPSALDGTSSSNLRFIFPHLKNFEESRFRRSWINAASRFTVPENEVEEWVNEIVNDVKQWVKYGI